MESQESRKRHERLVAYVLIFLFTLHLTLPVYVNSTYLSRFTGENWVGALYTAASLFTVFMFACVPKWLRRYGNYEVLMSVIAVELVSLVGLAYAWSIWFIVPFFIASSIAIAIGNFSIDIFVEHFSSNNATGSIRGLFLTCANIAWALAPLLSGLILQEDNFSTLYMFSAALLLPTFFLARRNMRHFKDPAYTQVSYLDMIKEIKRTPNIHNILMSGFFLQFFYAWMVIYSPIYLNQYIGFDWGTIGFIFSLMLLPYIFIEIPLGKLADTRWGEKEVLTCGFIVMAISTAAIFYIHIPSVAVWIAILFITRIGASMVEIMSETYFFKKVETEDIHLISAWRTLRPLAYVISPIVASVFLLIFPLKYIFLLLGFLMFYGIHYSLAIEDTK